MCNGRAGDNRTDHNIFENFCGRKKFDSAKVQFSFDPIFSLLNFHFQKAWYGKNNKWVRLYEQKLSLTS